MENEWSHPIIGLKPMSQKLVRDLARKIEFMTMDVMQLLEKDGYMIDDFEGYHTEIVNETLINIVSYIKEQTLARQRLEN